MEDNYIYGDVPVGASISSSQHASPEALVNMACEIWKKVLKSGVKLSDEKQTSELLFRIQSEYKDFSMSFPLVVKWMTQLGSFDKKAFKEYLTIYSSKQMKSPEDFIKIQAEYVVLLYKYANKKQHLSAKDISKYREHIVSTLLKEHEEFMRISKEVEEEMKKNDQAKDMERRKELIDLLSNKIKNE
jgi:hypothetical protein